MSDVSDLEEIFRALRAACSSHTWSRGVELARASAASLDPGSPSDGDELEFSVRNPGHPVARRVTLYPDDADWECDCGPRATLASTPPRP